MEKYKIKEGFVLRKIKDNYIVVALGKASKEFNGMISLNESGAFLWKLLDGTNTFEDIVNKMMAEYEISEDVASTDVKEYIKKLEDGGIIE